MALYNLELMVYNDIITIYGITKLQAGRKRIGEINDHQFY